MMHQQTDLPASKHKRKAFKSRPPSCKCHTSEQQVPPYKRKFYPKQAHMCKERCSKCGDSRHVEGFKCPEKKYQCKYCHKYGNKYLSSQEQPKHTSYRLKKCVCKMTPYVASQKILPPLMIPFIYK